MSLAGPTIIYKYIDNYFKIVYIYMDNNDDTVYEYINRRVG